jgi:membrane-bound ClpP family serine protease
MNLVYIIVLLVLGALFLMAEIVLLPGVTIVAILALGSYAGAIYLGFAFYGTTAGVVVVVATLLLSLITVIFSLRAKTWQKLSLQKNIDSVSSELPEHSVAVGARGVAISRIAPMGTIEVDGKRYEAKSDLLIDQRDEVEVVGFENFSVLVKKVEK